MSLSSYDQIAALPPSLINKHLAVIVFKKPASDIPKNYVGTWDGFGKIMDWLVPVIGEYRMGRDMTMRLSGGEVPSYFSIRQEGHWLGHRGGSVKIAAGKVALSVALNAWPVQVRERTVSDG